MTNNANPNQPRKKKYLGIITILGGLPGTGTTNQAPLHPVVATVRPFIHPFPPGTARETFRKGKCKG